MKAAIAEASIGLRLRRRRTLLTAVGIVLAAAMLAAAIVVSDSLGKGFSRAARQAHLADIIVRFDSQPARRVARRINALPDIRYFSLRQEVTNVSISSGANSAGNASVEIVQVGGRGPHGYALVAGHDVTNQAGQVVVERGLAAAWHIPLNGTIDISGLGAEHVVGFAEEPDNVAYPLAVPQIYISRQALGPEDNPYVNEAQIWLKDPRYLNEVLVQARATSYGVEGLRFVTRSGVRVLLDQAAGIVIDLLVALSLIALATAGVLLAASARAEVERRMAAIGVRRAVGAPRGFIALTQAIEALLIAVPAATLGTLAGALATGGPSDRLLMLLNEPSAGARLIPLLAAGWAVSIAIPTLAAAWPAWRAAGRPPVELLRGAELKAHGRSVFGRRTPGALGSGGSLAVLGGRLAGARRTRLAATAVTLGCSTAFVLLMLALASGLSNLETDPQALGKRYQLTAALPPSAVQKVKKISGVQAVAPRYEDQAVDSFSLGETIDVIGYPGNPTTFEAPPLTAGHRPRGPDQAEVGTGLADALGLSPGSLLAVEFQSGKELRLRVAGVVGSFDHDGRVAYVPAKAMLRADPFAPEELAIIVKPGANTAAVQKTIGPAAAPTTGAIGRGVPLVQTLRAILTAIAIVDGLVCLYALTQACALIVQERRRTVAVLRAFGAGPAAVGRLLAGAAAALVVPAAALGIVLEATVLGPSLSSLAANYATLPLAPTTADIAAVLIGLALAAAVAVAWVTHRATSESVVLGLAGP
ncbi:MAG: ABC transporter permease [Solirubrobacterales bacterium]|nr:ABC transporter permease [Solirubrobacterales bacterium]